MGQPALTADEQRQVTQQTSVNGLGERLAAIEHAGYPTRHQFGDVAPATAGAAAVLAATALAVGATTVLTSGFSQPDVPRALSITGNQASVAGNVVIEGLDVNGQKVTETIVAAGAATVVGTRAIKTVTKITLPAQAAGGDTISVGTTTKLGLPKLMFSDSILLFQTDLVKDTYTLARSTAETALNTIIPNNAPNGARKYRVVFLDERA